MDGVMISEQTLENSSPFGFAISRKSLHINLEKNINRERERDYM